MSRFKLTNVSWILTCDFKFVKAPRNKLHKTPTTTRIKQKLQETLAKLILKLQVHDTFFGEKVQKNQLKHIFMGQSSRNKSHLITF